MTINSETGPDLLPPLVLGGAGFSYLTCKDPESIPIHDIIRRSFDYGIKAIDTAPYYEPSEELIGRALVHPEVTDRYKRSQYILMTKVGRTGHEKYDYSPSGVEASVQQSLKRLNTDYLDVVFCHDIEAVTSEDVLTAVKVLLDHVQRGTVRHIGLSSYRIDILAERAQLVSEHFSRPVDVIQVWGQMTIQSSMLESQGLEQFKAAGVTYICASSPLAIGLLREDGVPEGKEGNSHPAPQGLRASARKAALAVRAQGESLATLALRYTLSKAWVKSTPSMRISTLTGISSIQQLEENVAAAKEILKSLEAPELNQESVIKDKPLVKIAQAELKDWLNWQFTSPPAGWSQELKRRI